MRAYEVIFARARVGGAGRNACAETRRLLARLDEMKAEPFCRGDFQQRDTSGRINEIVLLGDWLMTFWSDHAAAQIHVVDLERTED